MADIIKVPVKTFPDGEKWLLLDSALGKRVALRAHEITLKQNVQDYDGHHGPEVNAKESVKCKARSWDISNKVISIS